MSASPQPAPDESLSAPVHAVHRLDDSGYTTRCGLTWLRWSEPKIEATAQWQDVTCEECLKEKTQ